MFTEIKLYKDKMQVVPLVDIDENSASTIRREIDDFIDKNNFNELIFDFNRIDFMDSTGIGMILGRYKKLRKKNVSVAVKNANQQIDKVLRASGIYELFLSDY